MSQAKSMLPAVLTLQERVRRFNLGTPTPMHVGTHYLVNDLWSANADMLAVLKRIRDSYPGYIPDFVEAVNATIAKAEPSA